MFNIFATIFYLVIISNTICIILIQNFDKFQYLVLKIYNIMQNLLNFNNLIITILI